MNFASNPVVHAVLTHYDVLSMSIWVWSRGGGCLTVTIWFQVLRHYLYTHISLRHPHNMDIFKKIDPSALFSAKDQVIVITGGGSGEKLGYTTCRLSRL